MKIWDVSIRRPVFMTMILAAGVVLGLVSYFRMPVNLFPDVEFPVIIVTTVYPGASPEEMEDQVTSVMEEELGGLAGLDTLYSRSSEGISTIIMEFDLDSDVDKVSQRVQEEVGLLRNRLPEGIKDPLIGRYSPTDAPILQFGVADTTGSMTPSELRSIVEDRIQARLERTDGVAKVNVDGGQVREIKVLLDMEALEARRIAPQQVLQAIGSENLNIPGGTVDDGQTEFLVRTPGDFASIAEIEDVIIANRSGAPVYLRDVATVVDGFEKQDSITRLNGEESVVVSVRKESGTNTTRVANNVKEVLQTISAENPTLNIAISGDESEIVKESTNGAIEDLFLGMLLASLVIFVFFRDVRNTLITIAGLPVIMIASLFFMDLLNISLNQVSLLALALVTGLVIDDAIVVRENILRWIEKGYRPVVAASKATAEVVLPVIATSATILAVFLPVAYAQGIIGKFFRDFGLTVSIAIVVSTFEALTMAPMLSAKFFRASEDVDRTIDETRGEENAGRGVLDRFYAAILNWTMDHKIVVALLAIAVIVMSVLSARSTQMEFLPELDRGTFNMSMELPAGTSLAATYAEAVKVENIVRSHPNVADVFTTVGGTGAANKAKFVVKVESTGGEDVATRTVIDELRAPLASVPGISFQLADVVGGSDVLLGSKDIIVQLSAESGNYAELGAQAEQLAEQMKTVPGITDLDISYKAGAPELQLRIDRQRAADLGLSTAQIGSTVRMLVNGEIATTYRGEGEDADVRVQLDETNRNNAEDILNIGLLTPSGQYVPLRTIAEAKYAIGPNEIVRTDRRPTVSVGANVSGRSKPDAVDDVAALLATLELPNGMDAKLAGDTELQQESFRNLSLALLLAIIFIYMVLASQFESFIQPLLIMVAMPLAVIGALLALSFSGRVLDMTAFIGFIMLMGLVTKNSILLVDFANRERASGVTADIAMRRAGAIRLRPILMTALSLILAMIPVALGVTSGGEFRSSMAIAIMGGMTTSTFLTLLIVPAAYSVVVGALDKWTGRRHAHDIAERAERQRNEEVQDRHEPGQGMPSGGTVQPVGD